MTRWQDKFKDVFEDGKTKLDERVQAIKESAKERAHEKAIREQVRERERENDRRKQKIREERLSRQAERRRLKRIAVERNVMLIVKIVLSAGVLAWACWFTTDFVHNYDIWIAKYHKWSFEYEAQAPARTEAKAAYEEKKRLEAIAAESKAALEKRRKNDEIALENARVNAKQNSTSQSPSWASGIHSGKSEKQLAEDLSNTYDGIDMSNPNFDVGGYCLKQEKKGAMTFNECMGTAILKADATVNGY